jgi:hypothetical protein
MNASFCRDQVYCIVAANKKEIVRLWLDRKDPLRAPTF